MDKLKEVFKNHVVVLKEFDGVSVLKWKEPGTNRCAIKYILSGSFIYISGDLGEAIFHLNWDTTDLKVCKDISANYFNSKLVAFCGNKYDFDEEKAIKELDEEIEEVKEILEEYKNDEEFEECIVFKNQIELLEKMKTIIKKEVSNRDVWEYISHEFCDKYSKYDPDCCEWLPNIGRTVSSKVKLYLLGLQMAYDQLNSEEVKI